MQQLQEEVIEKPFIASTVGAKFNSYVPTELIELKYGNESKMEDEC